MRRLMDAVRGKVDVKSRQSLGILRCSVSYGGQGILKIPADLVATPPCAQRSEGASFSATRRAGVAKHDLPPQSIHRLEQTRADLVEITTSVTYFIHHKNVHLSPYA